MLAYWMITASLLAAGCGYIVGRLASAHVWQDEVGRLAKPIASAGAAPLSRPLVSSSVPQVARSPVSR